MSRETLTVDSWVNLQKVRLKFKLLDYVICSGIVCYVKDLIVISLVWVVVNGNIGH